MFQTYKFFKLVNSTYTFSVCMLAESFKLQIAFVRSILNLEYKLINHSDLKNSMDLNMIFKISLNKKIHTVYLLIVYTLLLCI